MLAGDVGLRPTGKSVHLEKSSFLERLGYFGVDIGQLARRPTNPAKDQRATPERSRGSN